MAMAQMSAEVDRVRSFNRFYTRRIGVLDEAHLDSGFTLTEARLIYELAQGGAATAKGLRQVLDLDAGYVSRMLRRLESAGLLARSVDPDDGRSARISLTDQGLALYRRLNRRSQARVEAMLGPLSQSGARPWRRRWGSSATLSKVSPRPRRSNSGPTARATWAG